MARLPKVLVVPRGGDRPDDVELLDIDAIHHHTSASDVRAGAAHAQGWILDEAAAAGLWTDPSEG